MEEVAKAEEKEVPEKQQKKIIQLKKEIKEIENSADFEGGIEEIESNPETETPPTRCKNYLMSILEKGEPHAFYCITICHALSNTTDVISIDLRLELQTLLHLNKHPTLELA